MKQIKSISLDTLDIQYINDHPELKANFSVWIGNKIHTEPDWENWKKEHE